MAIAGNIIKPEFDYQSRAASHYEAGHLARCFGDEAAVGFTGSAVKLDNKLSFGLGG